MNNDVPKQNRSLLDTERNKSNQAYDQFLGGVGGDVTKARGDASSLFSDIRDRYSKGFMPSGLQPGANGWFDTSSMPGMGGSKGVMPDFSSSKGGYQKFAETGGINRGDFDEAKNSYSRFISDGGINSGAIRNSVNQTLPGFYQSMKNDMSRRRNTQGGYSPGFDAQSAELSRQLGREKFKAGLDAESNIAGLEQQGRMFGTSGSAGLADRMNTLEQSGKLAGLGGLTGIADSEASYANSNSQNDANRQQAMQLALLGMYQDSGLASAQGMQGLYSSAPGALGQAYSSYLSGLGGRTGSAMDNLGARSNVQNRSAWDLVPGILGAGAGVMTGANSFRRPKSPSGNTGIGG